MIMMVQQEVEEYGAKSSSMFRALPGHLGKGMSALYWSQMVLCQKRIKLCDSTGTMPIAASITLRHQNLKEDDRVQNCQRSEVP